MRHHGQHVSFRVTYSGRVFNRTIRVYRKRRVQPARFAAVAKYYLIVPADIIDNIFVPCYKASLSVGNRHGNDLSFFIFTRPHTIILLNPEIDPNELVEGTYEEFESFDGLRVPGILYRPRWASGTERVPAVVFVHGGPGGQSVLAYTPMIQLVVNHGFAVFCVNNRGSSGYGKTFFRAADHRHGDVDLDDCVRAGDYMRGLPFVDPDRVGIMGGSYGGYMTLAALAFRPDAFDAGVDLFGISNWLRTLREMPAWWGAHREVLLRKIGDPDTEEDYLRSISPLFHSRNIRKPLLVIQGANDPRVLKAESDEIVEKVREADVPVEYILFDDEGHGFQKKANQIRSNDAIVAFLEKYL